MMTSLARSSCRAGLAAAVLAGALLAWVERLPASAPEGRPDSEGLQERAAAPTLDARLDSGSVQQVQLHLVDRALADLQPSEPGSRQVFFVGFAGFGPGAVFKREVVAVQRLFDDRFGTKGRSVALINHVSTVDEVPLASLPNLERVLQHLGRIMDASRDTLFLFLTSHGERAVLAVEMQGVDLAHLTPPLLKAVLDRSGIKNSVIVVSACHSGSFIPALAGPRTLVIAAARADRTSFGCADHREWTYFGEAYFNRALREETSFKRAFKRAKQLIEGWEVKEKLLPSLPQMVGGEALALID